MGTCLKLRPKPCPFHSPIPAARSIYIPYTSTEHYIYIYIYKAYTYVHNIHAYATQTRCWLPQPFNNNLKERLNGEKKIGASRALNYHYVNISYRIDRQSILCKTLHFIVGKEKGKTHPPPIKYSPSPPFHLNPSINESVTMVTSNFYKCIFSPPHSPPRVKNTSQFDDHRRSAGSNLRIFPLEPLPRGRRRSNQHVQ